jgi:hypothetical protein
MPEIFDVLFLPTEFAPRFTVDLDVSSVPIQMPVTADTPVMKNTRLRSLFTRGDNFTILSAGYVLPECFTMASSPAGTEEKIPCIIPALFVPPATSYYIPELNDSGGIGLPMENFESGINVFIGVEGIIQTDFYLSAEFLQGLGDGTFPMVSTLNCPAGLDGTVQLVTVFVKIIHNIALRTPPAP